MSKIISFVITSLALLYLILIPLGIIDQQNRRFSVVDLGIFVSILLINSDKLSKLKFGKEGFSIELLEKLKESQEKIQNEQEKQNQNLQKLQEAFESFVGNNKEIIEKIGKVKLPDNTADFARIIARYIVEELGPQSLNPRNIITAITATAKRKTEDQQKSEE